MKRFPSPKLAARIYFFYLKNCVKIEHKCKFSENCLYLGMAGNIAKSSKLQP